MGKRSGVEGKLLNRTSFPPYIRLLVNALFPTLANHRGGTAGFDGLQASDRLDQYALFRAALFKGLAGKAFEKRLNNNADQQHKGNGNHGDDGQRPTD